MRLLLMLAAVVHLGGDPGLKTISGTITANSGSSLTVTSPTRSLTCAVTYAKGQAVILRWGTGVRAEMACKRTDGGLLLVKLIRLGRDEPKPVTTTTTTTATTEPAPPAPELQKAIGLVTALSSTSVTVGDLTCSITGAPDSQTAVAKLMLGARAGIVCRPDGGRFVLSGATTG
jgi:hypothetical protein